MPYHQLQLFDIKTMRSETALRVPQGTPTASILRKEGRTRTYGILTIDCAGEAELVDLASFLVARTTIIPLLHACLGAVGQQIGELDAVVLREELKAAIFMAEGRYAEGAGPAQPIAIDVWRRRNSMAPKYGHLTESEVREHVKAMDEHLKRAYDPNEPFEAQLRRYVAQLQEDAKQWTSEEAAVMGKLLRELEAGYVLDRGETAHMLDYKNPNPDERLAGISAGPPDWLKPKAAGKADEHFLGDGNAVDEL